MIGNPLLRLILNYLAPHCHHIVLNIKINIMFFYKANVGQMHGYLFVTTQPLSSVCLISVYSFKFRVLVEIYLVS